MEGPLPELSSAMPDATEEQGAGRLVEEMSIKAAKLLERIFQRQGCATGWKIQSIIADLSARFENFRRAYVG